MSEADDIFEQLGYNLMSLSFNDFIWYQKRKENVIKDIMINIDRKEIACETEYFDKKGNLLKKTGDFTIEELQAINKKISEVL